jgi:hypothetical protein
VNHFDVDSLTISAEYLLKLYETQEILNIVSLMKLHRLASMQRKLEVVKAKRISLGNKLTEIMLARNAHAQGSETCPPSFVYRPNISFLSFDSSPPSITTDAVNTFTLAPNSSYSSSIIEPQNVSRINARGKSISSFTTVMNAGRYTTRNATGSLIRNRWADEDLSWAINDSLYMNSFNSHGGGMSVRPLFEKGKEVEVKDLLGSSLIPHVPHASFISSLDKGNFTEVFQANRDWTVGIVQKKIVDAGVFVRQLKIMPLGGAPGDAIWVCVEDGRLAPIGTNVSYQAFLSTVQLSQPTRGTSQAKMTFGNNEDVDEIMITI